MVGVAQLVRAPGCGPGGRGFDSHLSPQKSTSTNVLVDFYLFTISFSLLTKKHLSIFEREYVIVKSEEERYKLALQVFIDEEKLWTAL